jgi:hypothetical protein
MIKRSIVFGVIFFQLLLSQDSTTFWRVEGGVTISHFQQQVKRAVGDVRGQRLVNEFHLGLALSGGYRIHEYIHAGMFVRADRGERYLARFNGFDAQGRTQTKDGIGGTYSELWIGLLLQLQWKQLSLDLGYAPYGSRLDNARGDIPNDDGITDGAFSLHPTIAWLISLGGNFSLVDNLDAVIKIEYRPRYYSKRGGVTLLNDIEHGTQSIVPVFGIAYRL